MSLYENSATDNMKQYKIDRMKPCLVDCTLDTFISNARVDNIQMCTYL